MKTLMPAMSRPNQIRDVDDAIGNPATDSFAMKNVSETSEAMAARNPTDMEAAYLPLSMKASLSTVKRGYLIVARDLDVTDPGIDAPDQRKGGRLDQGGFLGRASGWSR